ncbi:alcohol dehydrogenase catalytic domain-containing protein [Streptomyces sp. NPDC047070]|uniref:zinc-dependent alcohol dehydrogenase n=1 Tax=Streptomyces sp. NPDC047070 TaxID=3154923 RepID=UPI00345562B3
MRTQTMQAIRWAGPGQLAQDTVPVPAPASDRVLVEVTRVGICGSDLAIWRGEHARAQPGVIIGHEFVGVVAHAFAEAGLAPGDHVAVRPLIACEDRGTEPPCRACASGNSHVCTALGLYGVDEAGGLAQYVSVRTQAVHPVHADVPDDLAVLAEPLAVAVHAVHRSGLGSGDTVAIFGAGPIGLLTALVARHRGAGRVILVEPNDWRRRTAEQRGFTVLPAGPDAPRQVKDLTGGDGADIVFDSAGHPSVALQITEAARIQGTVVVAGVHKQPPAVDLRGVNFAEQVLIGTRVYSREDFLTSIGLLETDELDLASLPTTTYRLAASQDAFHAAGQGEGSVKILIDPTTAGS